VTFCVARGSRSIVTFDGSGRLRGVQLDFCRGAGNAGQLLPELRRRPERLFSSGPLTGTSTAWPREAHHSLTRSPGCSKDKRSPGNMASISSAAALRFPNVTKHGLHQASSFSRSRSLLSASGFA